MPFSFLEGNETHLSEESVQAGIGLSSASHVAGEGNRSLATFDSAMLIHISDLNLDRGVIVRSDEGVGG